MEKIYIIILNFIHHHFCKYQPSIFQQDSYRFLPIKLTLSGYPVQLHILFVKQLFDCSLLLCLIYEL